LDKPLNYLNPSRIAIGALLVLLYIFFFADQSERIVIAQVPWYLPLLGIIVLLFLTSFLRIATLVNVGLGALLLVLAYRFQVFQTTFDNGQVIFVAILLLIVAVYVKRTEQLEL
jgi:uncharacterized membrane protein